MSIYYIIYKTIHPNGRYYIGRHQTSNLNDGYLGSGKWISTIKEKSKLTRIIVATAESIDELYKLEEHYIDLHWNDPLCMNFLRGSQGFSSQDSKEITKKRIDNKTHHLLKRPDGTSVASEQIAKGTHPLQKRPDGTSVASDRVKNGTNPFLKRVNGSSISSDMVQNGTHPLLKRPDGTSVASEQIKKGKHPLLKRPDGTSVASDRVKNGTNPFLQLTKGKVSCVDKKGNNVLIPQEQYYSQTETTEDREWVHNTTKEAKRRKSLQQK